MAIPKHIIDLTALALQDRVLTFKEREVIVKAATKAGVFEERINEYLDNALQERLKSYSKEDLQHCPHCGAQTPLISDRCLFCGTDLKSGPRPSEIPLGISGTEAEIIEAENINVEIKRHSITNCPDCGAPYPLISNICPSCGHILHEQSDSQLNISNLIESINGSFTTLKNTPNPGFSDMLKHYFGLVSLFLCLACIGFLNTTPECSIYLYGGIGFFVLAIFGILLLPKSPVNKADDNYFAALHDFQRGMRAVSTFYGSNSEAKKFMEQFSETLDIYERNRKANRLKIAICTGIMLAALCIPFAFIDAKI